MQKEIESERAEQLESKTNLTFPLYKSILYRVNGTLFKSCNCSIKNLVSTKYILKKRNFRI